MEQWEIPSCSICYERLLSDLSLLPKCGHIYHNECLKTWLNKINSLSPNCPLCRKSINLDNIISLKYSITKSDADSIVGELSTDGDSTSSDTSQLDYFKSMLTKSSNDNLDLISKINTLEDEKILLEDRIINELSNKESLINENKDLKFNNERNKTTIQGLSNKLVDLKDKLKKFEQISKYLDTDTSNEASDIRSFLTAFNGEEKINFLLNRIVILESMINELNDMNQKIRTERDQMEINYKTTRREFINLYNYYNPRQSEDKIKLPGLEKQDFLSDSYENRRKLSKAVSKLKEDFGGLVSPSPDRLSISTSSIKAFNSTPDRIKNTRTNLNIVNSDNTSERSIKNSPNSDSKTSSNQYKINNNKKTEQDNKENKKKEEKIKETNKKEKEITTNTKENKEKETNKINKENKKQETKEENTSNTNNKKENTSNKENTKITVNTTPTRIKENTLKTTETESKEHDYKSVVSDKQNPKRQKKAAKSNSENRNVKIHTFFKPLRE